MNSSSTGSELPSRSRYISDSPDVSEIDDYGRACFEAGRSDATAALKQRDEEIERLRVALRPFTNSTLTEQGQVIGLMREDFERAAAALSKTA